MVLDIVNVFINDDTSIYVVGNSSVNNDNKSVIWHARLRHIGQDRLKRLAQIGFLRSLAKVNTSTPFCDIYYHLAKLREPLVNYSLFILISMAQ